MEFLRDFQKGLAFGLGEEEASTDGRTDTDTEKRHIEKVGQAFLWKKIDSETWCRPVQGQTEGLMTGRDEGFVPLCSDETHPLQPQPPRMGTSRWGSAVDSANTQGKSGVGRVPTMMKGNPSPTRKSMVHMSTPQTI